MKKFKELPKEIQEKMLEEQVLQGNDWGGFNWADSRQGHAFWSKIIIDNDFTEFYKMYPKKSEYPKVMWVSDYADFRYRVKRVVFMKKCGEYLAWNNAETIEDAKNETRVITCPYAKDIEPTIKLTKQEIARRLKIDIENLEII